MRLLDKNSCADLLLDLRPGGGGSGRRRGRHVGEADAAVVSAASGEVVALCDVVHGNARHLHNGK
jgi:hypothetical protein